MARYNEPAILGNLRWSWVFENIVKIRTHFRQILTGDRVLVLRLPLQAHLLVTLQNAVENFVRLCERFVRNDVERPLNDTQMALYCCPCSQVGALAVLAVFLGLNLDVKPFQKAASSSAVHVAKDSPTPLSSRYSLTTLSQVDVARAVFPLVPSEMIRRSSSSETTPNRFGASIFVPFLKEIPRVVRHTSPEFCRFRCNLRRTS